jgi:hypothetical protein
MKPWSPAFAASTMRAFAEGVLNAHQGVEQYPQRDYGPSQTKRPNEVYEIRSPHPVFPERGQQTVTATPAGQAEGRTWLGSGRAIPAWHGRGGVPRRLHVRHERRRCGRCLSGCRGA